MRRRNLLGLVAVAALAACGPELTGEQPVTGDVEIPVEGRSTISGGAWAEPENHEVVGNMTFSSFLALGLGADYPSALTVELGEIWQSRCLLEGTWTAESLEVGDRGVVDAMLLGNAIELDVQGAGQTELVLTGTYDGGCAWWSDAIGPWDVEYTVTVRVVQPVSAVLEGQPYSCPEAHEPLAVLGGALHGGFRVRAVDAHGQAHTLDNAEPTRQVAYAMRVPDGTSTLLPPVEDGLTGLVFEGAAGEVELVAASGPFATLELAAPAQVEALELAFVVPMGASGQDYVLGTDSDVVWDDLFVFQDVQRVVPVAGPPIVAGREACSAADPDWFAARVSPEEPALQQAPYMAAWGRVPVQPGWEITEDGAHTFTMNAPELAGGKGLSHQVEVVFR